MKKPLEVQRLNESLDSKDIQSEIIYLVDKIAKSDIVCLHESEKNYGNSWKQRGGQGAFMMLARKWDRLEKQVNESNYDIFHAAQKDNRAEGILDDIQDLRRYLMLVEAELIRKDTTDDQDPDFLEERCEWKTG